MIYFLSPGCTSLILRSHPLKKRGVVTFEQFISGAESAILFSYMPVVDLGRESQGAMEPAVGTKLLICLLCTE